MRFLNVLAVSIFSVCFLGFTNSLPGNDITTGTLKGRIIDVDTKAPLSDVNIELLGSNFGDASNADGTFRIEQIPRGDYTLKVTRIGYRPEIIEQVEIKAGATTERIVRLEATLIEFDEVVTTATRREQTANATPASVSILKRSDIDERNAVTFDQALESVGGLSVQRSIGVSVQSLSLRGSSDVAGGGVGNRVLLAIDGRPALSSDSGGALWSLVPMNFVERIEVVKGAFSSLYGSTAMGGVINVITQRPSSRAYFNVDVTSGFHELPSESIRVRDKPGFFNTVSFNHSNDAGPFSYLLSVSRKESDGHRQRSAYEFYNVYGKLFFDLANNRNVEVTLGGDFNRNDYPHTWLSSSEPLRVKPHQTDNVQRKRALNFDVHYYAVPNARVKYSSRFYFYRQYFRSEFNPDDPDRSIPGNEPFGLFIRSDSRKLGNLTQLDYYLSDKNYLIAGLDIQRDLVDSVPDTILYGKRQVNNFAVFAQDEHRFSDKFTANVGVRYDFNKLEGGRTLSRVNPKASLLFSPSKRWSMRFLAGTGFRAPSIAERFFQKEIAGGTSFKPNPKLDAEKVTSFEFGNRLRLSNALDFDVALFHNTYDDMIYWVNLTIENGEAAPGGGFLFQVQNLNKAVMQGVEMKLNLHPSPLFNASLNYTYLDAEDKSEVMRFGSLAYKVRHSFKFKASLHPGQWLFNVDGRYNSEIEEVFLYPNDRPDAFFVLNSKLMRQLGEHFTLSIGVNNLLNVQYEELARFRMPGRTWIFGSSYRL